MTAAIAVVGGAVGALSGWSAWSAARLAQNERLVVLPSLVDARALLVDLDSLEASQRSRIAAGLQVFSGPPPSAAPTQQTLSRLQRDLGPGSALEALAHKAAGDVQRWQQEVGNDLAARATAPTSPHELALLQAGQAQLFDQAHSDVASLAARLQQQASGIDATVRSGSLRTLAMVLLLAAMTVGIALLSRMALQRWVTGPVGSLASDVRRVSSGDLDHMIEPCGPPEIDALGRDVEGMRRRLRDELDQVRQSREALASKEPALVELRRELAPRLAGAGRLSLAAQLVPAAGILAGDWYDVVPSPRGGAVVALVDISGHGPAAGLFALQLKSFLLPALRSGLGPGDALGWVAEQVGDTGEQFATALVLHLDQDRGVARWANAGHPAALRHRRGGLLALGPTGPLLGPLPGPWETRELDLAAGDLFVLYTDGVTDARDRSGAELGAASVAALL
ncbi:MAG TPA: SpoIIE family protein phosphatase, partial [Acidimicrobiales bacterium]|nr:SpoIIE family protein phosphatase [Acidimicrobiales bacterium]